MSLESSGAYDYLFKLILIGDSSTGKSTLLHHFIHGSHVAKSHTVGVEFTSRLLLLEPRVRPSANDTGATQPAESSTSASDSAKSRKRTAVKCQVWDTAGSERFHSVVRSYYRGAAGCLLVYDVTNRKSFESLQRWLDDVRSMASEHLVVVVVGSKTDLVGDHHGESLPRQVSEAEAKQWADNRGLLFAETSSLQGQNIQSPFLQCAHGILDLVQSGQVDPNERGNGISPGDRGLRPHSRQNSEATGMGGVAMGKTLSFADVVQSGGGVSKAAARGSGDGGGGLVKVKSMFASKDQGGCC